MPSQQWYSTPLKISSVALPDVNIYACQTLDRYHLNLLNISFANGPIVNLDNEHGNIEQWTVDKDTAFQIGWDLNIVPEVKQMLIEQARQVCLPHIDLLAGLVSRCLSCSSIRTRVIVVSMLFISIFRRNENVCSIILSMSSSTSTARKRSSLVSSMASLGECKAIDNIR